MKIIYRISDAGYNKVKPDYITNENCLKNFVSVFGNQNLEIIADNCSKETLQMITMLSLFQTMSLTQITYLRQMS